MCRIDAPSVRHLCFVLAILTQIARDLEAGSKTNNRRLEHYGFSGAGQHGDGVMEGDIGGHIRTVSQLAGV